ESSRGWLPGIPPEGGTPYSPSSELNFLRMAGLGLLGGVALAPIAIYTFLRFGPTSPETSAEAARILATIRFPHHALPRVWFDRVNALLVIHIALGCAVAWRARRLFRVLLFLIGAAAVLTFTQILTGSLTLALLFPWRVSVFVLPIANALLIGFVLEKALGSRWGRWVDDPRLRRRLWTGVAGASLALGAMGVCVIPWKAGREEGRPEFGVTGFIARTKQAGFLYLAPVELEGLRLESGARVFVLFHSHPYKDVEVLEWFKRLGLARKAYEDSAEGRAALDAIIRDYGVTHWIVPTEMATSRSIPFAKIYEDPRFTLYDLRGK
ncbi:MAG: hypothetical protein NTW86_16295, partial [Candidatus Sumerlaeota bacterium]|nr:hypothetical protein [Candidatus Sumerlaeota bacterium]